MYQFIIKRLFDRTSRPILPQLNTASPRIYKNAFLASPKEGVAKKSRRETLFSRALTRSFQLQSHPRVGRATQHFSCRSSFFFCLAALARELVLRLFSTLALQHQLS